MKTPSRPSATCTKSATIIRHGSWKTKSAERRRYRCTSRGRTFGSRSPREVRTPAMQADLARRQLSPRGGSCSRIRSSFSAMFNIVLGDHSGVCRRAAWQRLMTAAPTDGERRPGSKRRDPPSTYAQTVLLASVSRPVFEPRFSREGWNRRRGRVKALRLSDHAYWLSCPDGQTGKVLLLVGLSDPAHPVAYRVQDDIGEHPNPYPVRKPLRHAR